MLTTGEKISITKKRNFKLGITKPTNYWQGKKRSEETKEKIRLSLIGNIITSECRNKISIGLKLAYKEGRKKPIRNSGRTCFKGGNIPWNKNLKGIHLSPQSEFKKGQYLAENNVNWKNGITKLNRLIRGMPEFREWRERIFKRDNYTCQACKENKKVSGELHPHHKKNLYKIIEEYNLITTEDSRMCEELWNIKNGVTLCKNCHFKYHGILKKAVNSGEVLTGNAEDNPDLSSEGLKVSEKEQRLESESQQ